MTRLTMNEVGEHFPDVLNRLAAEGETIVVERDGQDVALLVSLADAQALDNLEDLLDAIDGEKAYQEFLASGEEAIPIEDVAREFGVPLPNRTVKER